MKYPAKALTLFALLAISALAQPAQGTITITGDVPEEKLFTATDLAKLPRATVTDPSPNPDERLVYEGVWLDQLLLAAEVPEGGILRGRSLTTYVLAEASDGYQVVFSLAELWPEFAGNRVLVADKLNGQPLSADTGPFRLIAPNEQEGGRWVRLLTKLTVIQLRK